HAVAVAGGFTAAARLLHISQPTVTNQVRFLEDTYGIELFHRRGHRVTPTKLGEELFALAQKIFALESETVHLLEDSGELRSGHLRVGAVGPFQATEMLARFHARFPGIRVSVSLGNSRAMLDALVDYRTDVAVVVQLTHDARFHSIACGRDPIVMVVNRRHRFARRKSILIADLEGEGMIVREPGSTTRQALDAALSHARVTPHIVMEIGSREAIREAVIRGVGIAAVSEAAYVPDREIRMVRIADAQMFAHTHVVCLAERRTARLVKAFLDVVHELHAGPFTAFAPKTPLGYPARAATRASTARRSRLRA
ncbi:MAG TPA: LysR substrate-binding domain-containing protein, partial [Casimicrobiaceae bacterium]|nr:LysR substrate-binding domain-containing protein [Casimicrobiaceae bacterium]